MMFNQITEANAGGAFLQIWALGARRHRSLPLCLNPARDPLGEEQAEEVLTRELRGTLRIENRGRLSGYQRGRWGNCLFVGKGSR